MQFWFRHRWKVATILFITVVTILDISYLFYFPCLCLRKIHLQLQSLANWIFPLFPCFKYNDLRGLERASSLCHLRGNHIICHCRRIRQASAGLRQHRMLQRQGSLPKQYYSFARRPHYPRSSPRVVLPSCYSFLQGIGIPIPSVSVLRPYYRQKFGI